MAKSKFGDGTTVVWRDRKRFMGMPLSFTRYILVEKENSWVKLFTSIGFFNTKEEEVNVYRIVDSSLKRSLTDKIFGVGSLLLTCKDASSPNLELRKIKRPYKVRDVIAELVERERTKKRIRVSEFQSVNNDMDGDGQPDAEHDDFN